MLPLLLTLALQTSAPDFGGEGPLRNATFLPVSAAATAEIARGDRAWAAVKAGREASKARTEAFDAWREALLVSETGECVLLEALDEATEGLWPDPDFTHHRRSEGVAPAVLRRLHALPAEERTAWSARFETLSLASLDASGSDAAQLARIERDLPLTSGAARAALRLADAAFERAALADAGAWLARARRHVGTSGELAQALEARAHHIEAFAPPKNLEEAWRSASDLKEEGALRLEGGPQFGRRSADTLGRGVEPGLVWLNDGRVIIQSARALIRLELNGTARRHELGKVLPIDYPGSRPGRLPYASASSGGWPMLPATDGRDVVLVIGRGRGGAGNALACVRFDERGLPVPRWARSDAGWLRASEGTTEELATRWNYQPGPLVHGGRVYVQARETAAGAGSEAAGARISILAFDLEDGALLWKRLLTKAADLRADIGGRFGSASGPSSPGQPLAAREGRIFVGTNVGLGTLIDALDGRILWSFRSRRRDAEAAGWPGSRPAQFGSSGELYWTPFDSDHLYVLNAGPDLGAGLLRSAPRPLGEGEDLLTAREGQTLLFGRAGARWTLTARDRDWDRRDSLYLARGESFRGAGLASDARVWAASDRGLYCFDRTRDLFLDSVHRLADAGGGRGGTVYARGPRILVLGEDTLWTFRVPE